MSNQKNETGLEDLMDQRARDLNIETLFKGFLVPETSIAGGKGVSCSYSPNVGVGRAEVLVPFPGVTVLLYDGRYDSPAALNQVSKNLMVPDKIYLVRMIVEGEMTMRFGDKTRQLKAGQGLVYAYPQKEDMDLWPKAGAKHRYVHINLTERGLRHACRALNMVAPSAFLALPHVEQPEAKAIQTLDGVAFEHFSQSLWLLDAPDHLKLQLLQFKLGELFCLLSEDQDQSFSETGAGLPAPEVRKLRQLQGILDEAFLSPPSLEELTRRVGLNRRKLTEGFRALYGLSIGDYCQRHRLEKAHHLLTTTDNSITEIAQECGYEHTGNFSRIFKKRFNQTPRQVRSS